jgi:hypothetical protein
LGRPARPQLKRKDQVVLYGTSGGQFGSLVDYSGKKHHAKHSSITVHPNAPTLDYIVPSGYQSHGVRVASSILQRILREYKTLSKRIILTGNDQYIHLQTDTRVSLHRSDNLFGTLDPREDDLNVELSISTLSRVLKVTHFNQTVQIVCEVGLPVLLRTAIGAHGSAVDVFVQSDAAAPRI